MDLNSPRVEITCSSLKYDETARTDPVLVWHLMQLQAITTCGSPSTVMAVHHTDNGQLFSPLPPDISSLNRQFTIQRWIIPRFKSGPIQGPDKEVSGDNCRFGAVASERLLRRFPRLLGIFRHEACPVRSRRKSLKAINRTGNCPWQPFLRKGLDKWRKPGRVVEHRRTVMVVCAALAFFAGEHRAAAMIAAQAGVAFCLTYNAAKSVGRKRTE
jgi:hypothetical protein